MFINFLALFTEKSALNTYNVKISTLLLIAIIYIFQCVSSISFSKRNQSQYKRLIRVLSSYSFLPVSAVLKYRTFSTRDRFVREFQWCVLLYLRWMESSDARKKAMGRRDESGERVTPQSSTPLYMDVLVLRSHTASCSGRAWSKQEIVWKHSREPEPDVECPVYRRQFSRSISTPNVLRNSEYGPGQCRPPRSFDL